MHILHYDIFDHFPELQTQRLLLREQVPEDAEALLAYLSHPEVHAFISDEDTPNNLAEAKEEIHYWGGLFRRRQSIYWGISEKNDPSTLIGTCGFNYWNRLHHKVELSYDLAFEHWRKGYMTEALEAIMQYGFRDMSLHRVSATVSPDNIASIKLLEKLGFELEGCMKDFKLIRGEYQDALVYAKIS